jgi:hypothetical protein
MMASAALLVGVPSPAPSALPDGNHTWPALTGVRNDLAAVRDMLLDAVDPLPALSIVTLVEPGDTTAEKIKQALDRQTGQLEAGDTLILMLNGHGYHVPDADGDEGADDTWDEVFIASDGVPILDDEFSTRWGSLESGVTIIGLIDTCFAETSGDQLVHPAMVLPEPDLSIAVRTLEGASRLFLSASLQEQSAYETTVESGRRGVLSAALTGVWSLTKGARVSYGTLFGYAKELASQYDGRQTTRARFTGPALSAVLSRSPFSIVSSASRT